MARILVVEDEPIPRRLMARILQDSGHDVRAAGSLDQAGEVCTEYSPDVAVLDWTLADSPNGGSVARLLNDRCPLTRIIFLSAWPQEHFQRHVEDVPVCEFLIKPIGFQDLLEAVDRVLVR